MDINWIQDGKIAASCAPGLNLEPFIQFCGANNVKGVVRLTYNPSSYNSKKLIENGGK